MPNTSCMYQLNLMGINSYLMSEAHHLHKEFQKQYSMVKHTYQKHQGDDKKPQAQPSHHYHTKESEASHLNSCNQNQT